MLSRLEWEVFDNIDHLELYLFFDEDGNYVHIRTKEYVKIRKI